MELQQLPLEPEQFLVVEMVNQPRSLSPLHLQEMELVLVIS